MEDSPIGLDKWLVAMWLIVNCKNGISSCELARDLGVTQKSAWFMLHRIRFGMQDAHHGGGKLGGRVEVRVVLQTPAISVAMPPTVSAKELGFAPPGQKKD